MGLKERRTGLASSLAAGFDVIDPKLVNPILHPYLAMCAVGGIGGSGIERIALSFLVYPTHHVGFVLPTKNLRYA